MLPHPEKRKSDLEEIYFGRKFFGAKEEIFETPLINCEQCLEKPRLFKKKQ